jgi:ferric-dicitrate binding protein FerR (iron transport regulator)
VSVPHYARLAGKVLARHIPPVSTASPDATARANAIDAIEREIARRVARRRTARWVGAVAAAAAVVAVAAGFGEYRHARRPLLATTDPGPPPPGASSIVAYPLGGGASVWQGALGGPLAEGGRLSAGSRVETTPNGRAALAFATGTSAMLGESADLTVDGDEAMQVLRLAAGSVDLHVAKVSADHRFLVTTPDAEVEVRGTKFRVSIGPPDPSCGEDALTRLVVTEGAVVVRHAGLEKRVAAGEQWPSDCIAPVEISAPMPPSAAVSTLPSVASSLAEQNDLFAEAIIAKRTGESQTALTTFDRFLATYPSSPLAQSASVERMRLLRSAQSPRAFAAAHQYLARYPNGFARVEAEAIIAGVR